MATEGTSHPAPVRRLRNLQQRLLDSHVSMETIPDSASVQQQMDPLKVQMHLSGPPYGWEEAYTSDGGKYYINHVTQTTSWSLPVTSSADPDPPPLAEALEWDGGATDPRPSPSIETEM